jgi:hypothetical protein
MQFQSRRRRIEAGAALKSAEYRLTVAARLVILRDRTNSGQQSRDVNPYRIFGAGGGTGLELAIPDLALPEGPVRAFFVACNSSHRSLHRAAAPPPNP